MSLATILEFIAIILIAWGVHTWNTLGLMRIDTIAFLAIGGALLFGEHYLRD